MAAENGPLINEGVWVAISFVAFAGLVWKKAGSTLSQMMDKRAEDIKANLDEARNLREEAQAELQKYQKLSREAADQAEQITANAMAAAETIRANAEKAAEASIKRKEEQAAAKIKAMEAEVVARSVRTFTGYLPSTRSGTRSVFNIDDDIPAGTRVVLALGRTTN